MQKPGWRDDWKGFLSSEIWYIQNNRWIAVCSDDFVTTAGDGTDTADQLQICDVDQKMRRLDAAFAHFIKAHALSDHGEDVNLLLGQAFRHVLGKGIDLLSETDAPYMAPVPLRGRPNKSPYIEHIVRRMALLKDMEYEETAAILTENGIRFFDITCK